MILKALSKHLLNTTEVTTCRNIVKTYHVKILNGTISYSPQIFNAIFFFISQSETVVIKESHYFILRSYLATIFLNLMKVQVLCKTCSIVVKVVKLRQNQSINKLFFMKLLKRDGIKYHWWNPNTGERRYCLYLNLSILFRGESRTSATYKMNLFVKIVTASNHWLLPQKAASFQSFRGP